MVSWYPKAEAKPTGIDGGSMVGGTPRGTIHETQTTGEPGYNYGKTEPHMTLMPDGKFIQYVSFQRAARALRNLSGGVQTNRQGSVNVQIEVVAYSDRNDWTPAQIVAMREFVAWAETNLGIPAIFPRSLDAPRMTFLEWTDATGWFDHGMVPENTHYDVGMESGVAAVFGEGEIEMAIQRGDKGPQVQRLQEGLLAHDSKALPTYGADSDFGGETEQGVKDFQTALGLPVTGIADSITLTLILSYLAGEPGPEGPAGPQGEPGADAVLPASITLPPVTIPL